MTRLASGAVLVLATVAAVWFAPPWLLFLIAEGLLLLALREYRDLASRSDSPRRGSLRAHSR